MKNLRQDKRITGVKTSAHCALVVGVALFLAGVILWQSLAQAELVNIAPLSTVTSRPGGKFHERIIDGRNGTGFCPDHHIYISNKSFYFRFDELQPVRKIRFILPPNYYSIRADTTGDGVYNQELISVENGPGAQLWGVTEWTYGEWTGGPVNLYGLKMDYPKMYKFTKAGSNNTPPQINQIIYI